MDFVQTIITIIISNLCAIIASGGFWAYLTQKNEKKDLKREMLIGLGHDRIMQEGTEYIDRGYITPDEYENLVTYLWGPYSKLGGNGSAEHIMKEVDKLEVRPHEH